MNIEKNIYGAYVISKDVNGILITRQYYYYTKKEAIKLFRAFIKKLKND